MVIVVKKKGESDEKLITRFKKKVIEEGILEEVKEKERYEKPSQKRQKEKKRIKFQIELEKKRGL